MKIDLSKAIEAATHSSWSLRKLNMMLRWAIPFNNPHGVKIHRIEPDAIITTIPNWKQNFNHIKGIHACGLATAGEFCSGLVLLRNLDPRKYRLIMQKLEVEYFYQAREKCYARFELKKEVLGSKIIPELDREGVAFHTCEILVHDQLENHICTVHTRWQIKDWEKVKTKLA